MTAALKGQPPQGDVFESFTGQTGRSPNAPEIFSSSSQPVTFPEVSEFVSIATRRHQLRALLVRDDVQPSSIPQMFERAGLRMMRNTVVYSDPGIPRRLLSAWPRNAQEQLIAK